MITYLLDTLVNSIKTSLINKLGLDPSTEVDLDDFPQLIDDIPILDSVEELTVTQNGTYTGTDGVTYNPVNVNLPLGSKSVTANGTYTASDDSLQGYSSVTVDIDDTDLYRDTTDSTYESVKTLSNCGAFPMLSLKVGIEPVQDLHGYDSPWVGGAGKNKLPMTVSNLKSFNTTGTWVGNTYTHANVAFTILTDSDDNVIGFSINGTANDTAQFFLGLSVQESENVILNGGISNDILIVSRYTTTPYEWGSSAGGDTGVGMSRPRVFWIQVNNGVAVSNQKCYPMARLASISDSTFEPYSNICPISGWNSIDVYQSGIDTSNPTTHTTALSTTCYGGSKDIKGNERFTHGHIASYNGETLPSTWISDRDEYAEGTTPTIGAEVVYELATPTTATSDAIDLTLAEGTNNIWASTGDVGDARYFRKVEL